MKTKLLGFGLLTLVLLACVTTNAVRIGTAPSRPPISEDQVIIYRTADQVQGKYEEVALISAKGESSWTDESQMINAMKKKAGKMGANGIILDAMSEPSAGAKIAGAFLGTGSERRGKAIAIYVFPREEKKE